MTIKNSIIIAFYEKFDLLEIILTSLNQQYTDSVKFNVIIADDGSSEEVKNKISDILEKYKFEIKHIWHEDLGFRKNIILNKAIVNANEYLIFIDGDCIPQKNFVYDHVSNAEKSCCLNGRRVDLSEKHSLKLNKNNGFDFFKHHIFSILFSYMQGKGKNIEKGFNIRHKKLSSFLNRKEKGIIGCNFSLYKANLIDINGFDERYLAAGIGEDTDIEFRLKLSGVKIKNLFFCANQLHIYHPELPRSNKNDAIYAQVVSERQVITKFGIQQLSDSDKKL